VSHWTLLQVIFDVFVFVAGVVILWRIRRPPQDDPRLSRGLQLLQTKITVLEDLSDRTEAQVKQLTGLIDQKTRALQNKVIEAEQQIIKIDHTMGRGGTVIPMTPPQETIPPAEAAERQRTIEYVRAAKMANAGHSVESIAQQVSMPREQLELIAKFNREQLMFDESQLPEWAAHAPEAQGNNGDFALGDIDFVGNLDKPRPDFQQLAKIERDFKQAVEKQRRTDEVMQQSLMETKMAETIRASINQSMDSVQPAVLAVKATAQTLRDKLVSTAEDMLKQRQIATPEEYAASVPLNVSETYLQAEASMPQTFTIPQSVAASARPLTPPPAKPVTTTAFNLGSASPIVKDDRATVKKVIFPRIEKP